MKIVNWFWDHFWNLFVNRKWKLPAKGKSGMVTPNWYPPAPAPPVAIDAELVVSDDIQERTQIEYFSDVLRETLSQQAAERIKRQNEFFSHENIVKAIKNTIKYVVRNNEQTGRTLIDSNNIGIPNEFVPVFHNIFKQVCAKYNIKVDMNSEWVTVDNEDFNRAVKSLTDNASKQTLDDSMRKLLQPGPYR